MNEAAPQQVPDWLTKDFLAQDDTWEPEAQAWQVMPLKHPRTGQPLPQQHEEHEHEHDARETWPVGLVTPDGRWLLQPSEGACQVFVNAGHINVYYPEAPGQTGRTSGVMDLNGLWVVPPSADYRELLTITPHVVQCLSTQVPERNDLRSLPAMDLLQATITYGDWHPEDNTLRADRGGETRDQALVMDIHGQLLFESCYERIHAFDPKTGLAVAAVRQPHTESDGHASSRALEGVIHISGEAVVPCEFEQIDRSFFSQPPRIHPGGKLLAFSYEGQPSLFNTQGKLLASPPIYCPVQHRKVKKAELLALTQPGPQGEIGMLSIKDYSFTLTGQTWEDYMNERLRRP